MNRYPLWKNLLVIGVFLLGAIYALPNLYGEDPALQISSQRGAQLDAAARERLESALKDAAIEARSFEEDGEGWLLRLSSSDEQLRAQDAASAALGPDYTVALNLAPATPAWLEALGARPMYLGLDLRGGVHFLMEVETDAVDAQLYERSATELRTALREAGIRYRGLSAERSGLRIDFADAVTRGQALELLQTDFRQFRETEPAAGEVAEPLTLRLTVNAEVLKEERRSALKQNLTTLRNRIDELGVAEPIIQQQGDSRIVVQLPGVQDTARAKDILGATATVEFRLVDIDGDVAAAEAGRVPAGSKLYRTREGRAVLLNRRVITTGEHIINASSGFDQVNNIPAVHVTLDGFGGRMMSDSTKDNVGKPMAVVFVENKTLNEQRGSEIVRVKRTVEEVISIATIREKLSDRFQITGLDSSKEAHDLALLLRAGALAAPMSIVEERTVGPSLGQGNIEMGWRACLLGSVVLGIFLIVYYKVFGVFAVVTLAYNVVMLIAVLSILQATLTLPGIAGVLLTIGTAVDANVLIYERIREELRNGVSVQAAIEAGFTRANDTITDSNITTIIAALMLLWFGTGAIKGFAVTLAIGTVISMYTAMMGTRAQVNWIFGGRRIKSLPI
jgi:preprotein translocase subunit SecD